VLQNFEENSEALFNGFKFNSFAGLRKAALRNIKWLKALE